MLITAKLKHLRIAPRKVRLVADLIRGKSIEEAQSILQFTIKKPVQPILKLLKSGIANAKNNFQLNPENLYISKIMVDEGPKIKRWMPRARGQAYPIQKRSSHITIVLEGKKEILKKTKKPEKKVEIKTGEISKEKELKKKPELKIQKTKIKKPKMKKEIQKIFRRKSF